MTEQLKPLKENTYNTIWHNSDIAKHHCK